MNEILIAKADSLNNGEMKSIKIDNDKEILLCKIDDKFFATGASCPHYGAPLADGLLSGDRIVCPWHHSCFNAKTGALLDPPAFDSLNKFEVRVDKGSVYVSIPDDFRGSINPPMVKPDTLTDKRKFVIIGAGAAAYAAAQALREDGFKGSIRMITTENRTPYDRPNLSKAYLSGEAPSEWMPLRPEEFYQEYGIEVHFGKRVVAVDFDSKKISFENGDRMNFDKLLIATGGTPRKLDVPGADLKNIFYLRSFDSSDAIIEASKYAKKIIIAGSSFIGMETAISLMERSKLDITIVSPDDLPFRKVFGEEIGKLFLSIHEEHGIKFKSKSKISHINGTGKVSSVTLENGDELEADMIIAGIGVKPATDFLNNIKLEKDGSIKVDEKFSFNKDAYAAGDIASFTDKHTGNIIRIEHWRTAEQEGRAAAHAMAEVDIQFDDVPFFWTKQADFELKYVGHAADWDDIKVEGNIKSKDFVAYYIKDNKIVAAAGTREKEMAEIHEKMRRS